MGNDLWQECQKKYSNRSELELAAEQREQERQRSLQTAKRPATDAERKIAADRFRNIQAQKAVEKATAELDVIAQKTKEIEHDIIAALEIASPTEKTRVMATITPAMLRHMALHNTNFDIVEYVNAELQRLRAAKTLGL
jgi:hypothetical protein